MRRIASLLFAGLICFSTSQSLHAADAKSTAVTRIEQADSDFAWQGEYLGSGRNACGQCESVGLQVIAMGKGEFQAVEYRGGLPGYGWPIGGDRNKYTGKLAGDTLTLTSEKREIVINQSGFWVKDNGWQVASGTKVTRQSPTLGQCAPWGATVLFDGTNADHWKDGKVEDGLLKEGCETKSAYGDFQLHLEFMLPYMPNARGQGRANSGLYIQSRYEMQILDSFGLEGAINECGALYTQRRPDLNMCLPPLTWQTYDIWFKSPTFDEAGKKVANARITALLNGVPVQNDVNVIAKTGGGSVEGPLPLPTKLQNHGNPVRFRNIWILPHAAPTCPTACPAPAVAAK